MEERERPYDEEAVQVFMKQLPIELYRRWREWDPRTSLIERDSLIEAMKRLDLYPPDGVEGVYPDPLDPAFAERLFEKKEFADLRSKFTEEDICSQQNEFDTTDLQRFIARFMNPSTPYTSALLYHGVGVGKTCTAITVAEAFLNILPDKKVFILAPPSIAPNFIKTIFDPRKLVKLSKRERDLFGRRWDSPQCTGISYLTMSDTLNERDVPKLAKEISGIIKKRYNSMGYGEFANYVKKQILGRVPKHLSEEERIRLENEELYTIFSDHLIIIDEAHNLRDESRKSGDDVDASAASDAADGKLVRSMLERILPVADGMRLLLMTATPMYDISSEIVGLLNLLILNDTKDPTALLKRETYFTKKADIIEGTDAVVTNIAKRYVSYMRGENPYSFPIRLSPSKQINIIAEYPTISLSNKESTIAMSDSLKNILNMLPLFPTVYDSSTTAGRVLVSSIERYHKSNDEIEGEDGEINKTVFAKLISASNMIYPDEYYGNEGWKHYFIGEEFGELPRLRRYQWAPRGSEAALPVDSVFGPSILHQHSPKIATILKSLKTCKGLGFVYSRWIPGGILPLAIALERAGWTRVLANGHAEPMLKDPPPLPYGRQCALCEHHENSHSEDHPFTPANYVLLAGEDKLTPSVDATVQYATTFPKDDPYSPYGSRVKVIIGSSVASEGLDFKCIREIHLLDPWWHLNRIEQIIGRGVRFCSHARLPMEKRNCTIYLHVAKLPSAYETPDLYAYRKAADKSIQIGRLQRALKIGAFDCNIHQDVLFISPGKTRRLEDSQGKIIEKYSLSDKQYSSFCDFMETCTYECKSPVEDSKIASDTSTYKVDDLMRYLNSQFNKIKAYFQSSRVLYAPLQQIKEMFFKDVPWELVALGLRRKLNNASYIIEQIDGTRGSLQLQNGYLVFKPLTITDPEIPLALRHGYAYGRLPTRMISPLLTSGLKTISSIAAKEGTEFRITKSLEDRALLRLEEWSKEIKFLMDHPLDGLRPAPEGMTDGMYRLLQWIPNRFRDFRDVEKILMQFYMDRIWTLEDRAAVLAAITERRGASKTTPFDTILLSYLTNPEVFDVDGMYGFVSVTRTGEEVRSCKIGANPLGICPPNLASIVESVLEPPLNGIDGCAPIYGFHVFFKTGSLFKILNTEKLNPKNRQFQGSNCTITSNLDRMLDDLSSLYKYQKDHPNALLEPMFLKLRTTKEPADPYTYLNQLKSPELCIYTELLLRAFQACETGSLRWILSMVDSKRAVEIKIIKGKPVPKKIFENSFTFLT
jgi:hypothetical protein